MIEKVPQPSYHSIGLATAIFSVSFQIGTALGPTAIGIVAEISNLENMFIACGISMALGIIIIYILFKTRGSSK